MRLSLQTDYALRVLMHLAVADSNLTTIREIADRFSISRNHLMKIANALSHAGYVQTIRGRSGGMRLAVAPDQIKIGDLVEKFESNSSLVECFSAHTNACLITPACRLKGALRAAMKAFYADLNTHTLADLTRRNHKLKSLLLEGAIA